MKNFLSFGSVLLGCLLLQGCSAPQEDPRIAFCRGMAADLSGGDVADWSHADNRIVEPEYAVVTVQSDGSTVSCWYGYEAAEPGAMEVANPLLAFATLPYQVKVDDQVLKGPALTAAVKEQQIKFGRAVVDQAKRGVDQVIEEVRQKATGGSSD